MQNKYDWDQPLLPGTVVVANYGNFEGEKRPGLFIVLYDEQVDALNLDKKNVMAVKLSSKQTCVTNYSVELRASRNPFLNDDGIACCSKIHILHKQLQVYKVLGRLDSGTYLKVYKVVQKFLNEANRQMIDSI